MDDVIIGTGNLDGKGIYAARAFAKGEIVIMYHLQSLTEEEFNSLPDAEKKFVHTHGEIKKLYLTPERYVNHAQHPNTYQDLEKGCDIALRDITKGEAITTNATKDGD